MSDGIYFAVLAAILVCIHNCIPKHTPPAVHLVSSQYLTVTSNAISLFDIGDCMKPPHPPARHFNPFNEIVPVVCDHLGMSVRGRVGFMFKVVKCIRHKSEGLGRNENLRPVENMPMFYVGIERAPYRLMFSREPGNIKHYMLLPPVCQGMEIMIKE